MIVGELLSEDAFKMSFAKYDQVIQTLSADRAYDSFSVRILHGERGAVEYSRNHMIFLISTMVFTF